MTDPERSAVLIVGVGNELRGDDAAGIEVVRRLRHRANALGIDVVEEQNDASALIEDWRGRRAIVVVDALSAGRPGLLYRRDVSSEPLAWESRGSASTHAVGLEEAIELARSLGRLPERVIVHAVTGRRFQAGGSISKEVVAVLPELTERTLAEARSLVDIVATAG